MSAPEKNAFPPAQNSGQAPEGDDTEESPLTLRWATPEDEHVHCFRKSTAGDVPRRGVHECLRGFLFPAKSSTHAPARYYGRLLPPSFMCDNCGEYVENIADPEVKTQHQKDCRNITISKNDKIKESMNFECPVCLEVIKDKPDELRTFGLLLNCDHVFCISCVKTWFKPKNEPVNEAEQQTKGCPLCRRIPILICPCDWWIGNKAEKEKHFTSVVTHIKTTLERSCKACNRTEGPRVQSWIQKMEKFYQSDVGTSDENA